MAEATIKAVSPRVLLDMDLDEAKTVHKVLQAWIESNGRAGNTQSGKVSSVKGALTHGISAAEDVVKGGVGSVYS